MNRNKFLIFILICLIILPTTLAVVLEEGESTVKSGKTIKVVGIGSNKIVVNVDGVGDILSSNKTEYINGVTLEAFEIQSNFNPKTVNLIITVNQECGDDICEGDETTNTCCKDCGCLNDLTCTDNQCINPEDNECTRNLDCNDNNINTVDLCSGLPRKCSNEEIICEHDSDCNDEDSSTQDKCIDKICFFTLYSDLAECTIDEDCDDNITCTRDRCIGLPLKCSNEEITSCESYDDCCPSTCSYPDDLNCEGVRKTDEFDDLIEETIEKKEENITKEEPEIKEKVGFFKRITNWFIRLFT